MIITASCLVANTTFAQNFQWPEPLKYLKGPAGSGDDSCNTTIVNSGTEYEHKHCDNERRIPSGLPTICDEEEKEMIFLNNFLEHIYFVFYCGDNSLDEELLKTSIEDDLEIQGKGTSGTAIYSPGRSIYKSLAGINFDGDGSDYIKRLDDLKKYIEQDNTQFLYINQQDFNVLKAKTLELISNERVASLKTQVSLLKMHDAGKFLNSNGGYTDFADQNDYDTKVLWPYNQQFEEAKSLSKEAARLFLKSRDIVDIMDQSNNRISKSSYSFKAEHLEDCLERFYDAAADGEKPLPDSGIKNGDLSNPFFDFISTLAKGFWNGSGIDIGEMGMGMVDLAKALDLVDPSKYDTGNTKDAFSRAFGQLTAIAGTLVVQDYVLGWGISALNGGLKAWLNESIPVYHYSRNAEATLSSMLKDGVSGSKRVEGGLPQLFDKMRGETVSNLWITKYAPEVVDKGMIEKLFVVAKGNTSGEVNFALKSYATRKEIINSVINNPAELWKTGGVQYGSFVRNLEGRAIPLTDFEIVPLSKSAQITAKEVSDLSGGKIIVNDLTEFSTSIGAKTSYFLHAGALIPAAAIYGVAIPTVTYGGAVGTVKIITNIKTEVSTWLKNRSDTSSGSGQDSPATVKFGATALLAVNDLNNNTNNEDSKTVDLGVGSTTVITTASDQILALDNGVVINYYNNGHLIASEEKDNPRNNVYYFYDNDSLIKEISAGIEKNYAYSSDGTSYVVTIKDTNNTETKKEVSFDPNTDKITEKDLQTETVIETYLNKELDPIKVVQNSKESSTITADLNASSTVYSVKTPTIDGKLTIKWDGNNEISELISNQGTSSRKVITTKYYSDTGGLLNSKSDYFDNSLDTSPVSLGATVLFALGLSTETKNDVGILKPVGSTEINYSYKTTTQKNPLTGKDMTVNIPLGSSILTKKADGFVLYKDQVQFSEPDAQGVRSIIKGPITMRFNTSGQLVESSIDKNSPEFKANFAGVEVKDSVRYSYGKNGKLISLSNPSSTLDGANITDSSTSANNMYKYIIGAIAGLLVVFGGVYYVIRRRNLLKKVV